MSNKSNFELSIETRDVTGKGHIRRLRKNGDIPGIIYGGKEGPKTISINHNQLTKKMQNEGFYTSILKLNLGDNSESVVVKNVQRHPAKRKILHMDFQRILEDQKITLNVPIRFLNEESAIGVKMQGGEVSKIINDIEISCLPKNLPEYIEIDISNLELNQSLHVSDLNLPDGVEINLLIQEQNNAIVSINPPRREEEEAVIEDSETIEESEEGDSPSEESDSDSEPSTE
ncbi:MAG: 50S ribosomal protein L25/general stress protein Ctc [Pseudomonadota bacterium]|nr:50S ribosomal protein L25/general stress protein Ctc [Gammaproteobacteria bacterium]MEE2684066.1 50S ribosomal protein L25/general stress protein Ctc [Pseudomonadota bacterium]|tara:strand:+ start:1071 stop:1760 length:690 start_codon:yes stop_codon:yes gene_type:complete